jgi:WD40 repeat protein
LYTDYPAKTIRSITVSGTTASVKTGQAFDAVTQRADNGSYLAQSYVPGSGFEFGIYNSQGAYTCLSKTSAGGMYFYFDLNKAGNKIVYSFYNGASSFYELYVMDPDGTDSVSVATATGNEIRPAWSPDGTKIAYIYNNNSLYVMDANGGNRSIRDLGAGVTPKSVDWAPGNAFLAISVSDSNTNDDRILIRRADTVGGATVHYISGINSLGCLRWFSDDVIFFDENPSGGTATNIWKLNPFTLDETQLTFLAPAACCEAAAIEWNYWD